VDDSATKTADLLPATPSGETGPSMLRWLARTAEVTLLKRLNIGGKLTVGFGILVALTLLVVGLNYLGSFKAVTNINRTGDLRAPSALASAQAQANLLRMLGEVRGYLALGDEAYREGYRKAKSAFDVDLQSLEMLLHKDAAAMAAAAASGVDRKLADLKSALERWTVLPDRLFELRNDQLRREPALKILVSDANPLIASIAIGSKAIIGTQQRREASPANMALLADLASFQSSFFAMVSGLRGYVTTKRDTFKYEYESNLTINNTAWETLVRRSNLLDAAQRTRLTKIARDREAFLALPAKMFAAVEGEHAREDLFVFRTEAVPLAEEMILLLSGIANEEQALLQSDLTAGRNELASAQRYILIGGIVAVLLGLTLGFVFRENIAGPVGRLKGVAERVREGDLTARATIESGDEIGELATTFNQMTVRLGDSLDDLELRRREQETLAQKFRRQSEYLGALHDTTLGLISRLDLAELLSDLVERAGQLLGTPHGFIYLVNGDGATIERHVGVGVYAASIGQKLQPNEGVAGRVWQSGEALIINDYETWEGRAAAAARLELTVLSCMGVPLKSGDEVVGVLGMAYVEPGLKFGQGEVELLGRFAQLASISLDNARLFAAAKEARIRSEEANQRITEQNRMLESLSTKLSKYLSPQVYASIFTGRQSVEISSRRKKLTIFFSDIADFTETTDNLESEELTQLLNHYLTEMSKIALEHGATIDKYVGDAILAFFGDPDTRGVKEDALACVNMAVAMQRRMRELQREWSDVGMEKPFQLRIGINTGFCTVGNFGSEDRMDYTIIGGEVNLASRLQSHADLGGILMAHETYSLVKDVIQAEELERIQVKGFAQPIRTYRVRAAYDDGVVAEKVIRHQEDGLKIEIDLEKLSPERRSKAAQVIGDLLARLRP
jgi:class 3 adenylate cyclase/CHASE3 domain sensor protein/putative methionine-R-sulfoxide reductase with GAF domain